MNLWRSEMPKFFVEADGSTKVQESENGFYGE
jgi:hypothetical protein